MKTGFKGLLCQKEYLFSMKMEIVKKFFIEV
jgi:hypothetical protein